MRSLSLVALLGALPEIRAQFVAAPTNLTQTKGYLDLPVRYKQVPTGICETDPTVKSFSGYVDVAEDQHIFFWFFEARNQDPETAPLTVWINGGEYCRISQEVKYHNGKLTLTRPRVIFNDWPFPGKWTMRCR